MGMDHTDLRQASGDEACVTASRYDVSLLARKLLCLDSGKDFLNQSTKSEYRARKHRLDCRFTDRVSRFFQRNLGQKRRSLVKKVSHRFESWCNHAADVSAPIGNDVESHGCAKIHHDRGKSIKLRNCRSVRQSNRADRLRPRIINSYTEIQLPIQPEHVGLFVCRDRKSV